MNLDNVINLFKDCENEGDKIIIKSDMHKIIDCIKNKYSFDILKEIIAIDNNNDNTELIYNLHSTKNEEDILLSITVKKEAESIVDIFPSAQADENEIYDMFGIIFIGNDNLKRLYMPESWSGNPLKKSYSENDERLNWNDNSDS